MSTELARAAYEGLEPYHVLSYFNPHNKAAAESLGISALGLYFGGRGAPLGRCPAPVITATFFNFNPAYVNHGWTEALGVGLDTVVQAREGAVDASLREALGDAVDSPELPRIVAALRAGIEQASYVGRPLAAAWAYAPWPDTPHLQLWHALSIAREHRGDGHLAALTLAGLGPVEALVLHEAPHPRAVRRRSLGKKSALLTRGWTEQDWDAAEESLRGRGLLDGDGAMTADGGDFYDQLEQQTDAAAAGFWAGVPDAEQVIALARPFVKAVIDSGFLPGTRKTS
ncbi:SCO6745 family protein [Calidifontibacter terrae]